MKAVMIESFGAADDVLKVVDNAACPSPAEGEILVRVNATSVNPIDCALRAGYGAKYFLARGMMRLPLIPGRDVAGTVEKVGAGVTGFVPRQKVYAGVMNYATAEFISIPAAWAAPMPDSLSFTEAAALPFAALTAWSALVDGVGLTAETTPGKRVVIPRGAGGVGSFAIQLMKAWGAHVASVVSTRNVELVGRLGADAVVDSKRQDFTEILRDYDVALDSAPGTGEGLLGTLKVGADAAYVAIVSPRFRLMDEFGVEEGSRRGDALLAQRKAEQAALGRRYEWAFMRPNGGALRQIGGLVDSGAIRPLIDRVYPIEQIAEAHKYCESGAAQGKIVISIAA